MDFPVGNDEPFGGKAGIFPVGRQESSRWEGRNLPRGKAGSFPVGSDEVTLIFTIKSLNSHHSPLTLISHHSPIRTDPLEVSKMNVFNTCIKFNMLCDIWRLYTEQYTLLHRSNLHQANFKYKRL